MKFQQYNSVRCSLPFPKSKSIWETLAEYHKELPIVATPNGVYYVRKLHGDVIVTDVTNEWRKMGWRPEEWPKSGEIRISAWEDNTETGPTTVFEHVAKRQRT